VYFSVILHMLTLTACCRVQKVQRRIDDARKRIAKKFMNAVSQPLLITLAHPDGIEADRRSANFSALTTLNGEQTQTANGTVPYAVEQSSTTSTLGTSSTHTMRSEHGYTPESSTSSVFLAAMQPPPAPPRPARPSANGVARQRQTVGEDTKLLNIILSWIETKRVR
jgi:hypothetical protein